MRTVLIIAFSLLTFQSAWAQGPGIIAKAGTLGAGLDIGWAFNKSFDARISLNGYSYDDTFTESNIEYDADVDLRTAGLLLDWHPFRGSFRLTAGAYANDNELAATGKPTGGIIEINGVPYPASSVGSLSGVVDFDRASPYVGLGFGTMSKSGLRFTFDLGVLYQQPAARLAVVCGSGLTAPQCAQLQSDVAAEEVQLNNEIDDYRFYPVVTLGIGWVF